MKQLIFVFALLVGFGMTVAAQESKEKVKVESPGYKKKVETEGTHHTAMYSQSSHRAYVAHHYATHRHIGYRRHVYHRHVIHHRRHIHRRPAIHYKKIKHKKGEYKAKA